MLTKNHNISLAIRNYYKKILFEELGILYWEKLISNRFLEDGDPYCKQNLLIIEKIIGSLNNKKIFIIGAGTVGEAIYLFNKNNIIEGIEPDLDALQIIKFKKEHYKINDKQLNIIEGYSESIPSKSNTFDFVCCNTVLEHVSDIKKSISEIIRILKPGAWAFINTPNYLYPYEGHYKEFCYPLALPLGKQFFKLKLFLKRKPTKFLNTLNIYSDIYIKNILGTFENIDYLYLYSKKQKVHPLIQIYIYIFGISKNQIILIRKHD